MSGLFYAIVVFFPSVLGHSVMSVPNLAHVSVHVEDVCEGFTSLCSSYQFVPALSGTSECARLSFYLSLCLDRVGFNSVD